MKFTIITLFPDMFSSVFDYSIVGRAIKNGQIEINFVNLRDFASDKYGTVDDRPYGGGVGMLLKVDVIDRALEKVNSANPGSSHIILTDPKGRQFTQKLAQKLTTKEHLVIVCGHYEGVDSRVDKLVDEKISIGNYILTGGEIPAMVIVDSVSRLIGNVLKKPVAVIDESFSQNSLGAPQYTRPDQYKKMKVPSVLLSGNHKKIADWKQKHAKPLELRRK
jgi:tRNA (guanine37-N1)-methyltransferase